MYQKSREDNNVLENYFHRLHEEKVQIKHHRHMFIMMSVTIFMLTLILVYLTFMTVFLYDHKNDLSKAENVLDRANTYVEIIGGEDEFVNLYDQVIDILDNLQKYDDVLGPVDEVKDTYAKITTLVDYACSRFNIC